MGQAWCGAETFEAEQSRNCDNPTSCAWPTSRGYSPDFEIFLLDPKPWVVILYCPDLIHIYIY